MKIHSFLIAGFALSAFAYLNADEKLKLIRKLQKAKKQETITPDQNEKLEALIKERALSQLKQNDRQINRQRAQAKKDHKTKATQKRMGFLHP